MEKIVWHTEKRKVSELKLLENNPRTITREGFEKLKKDISELGQFRPLVCDTDLTVLGGNQRKRVADLTGDAEIEVSLPNRKLTEEEKKKVIILDNEHRGEFDIGILANDYQDILKELDFSNLMPEPIIEVSEDDYEPPEEVKTDIKRGDIFLLGNHRLMCGDSMSKDEVEKLMDGKKLKTIFTSPPYNMGGGIYDNYDDNLKSQEFIDFNIRVIDVWKPYLSGYLFWNISYNKNARWEFIEILWRIIKETGLRFLELIVWDKGHGIPITSKDMLTREYEDIILAGKDEQIQKDVEMVYLGTVNRRANLFKNKFTGCTNYWRIVPNKIQRKDHLGIYPIQLPARGIIMTTSEEENVGDPFGGSGSTLIACEQTNRICYMMEIDEKYCEVICQRWEKLTGKTRTKVERAVG
jgi:DNA modification methylase